MLSTLTLENIAIDNKFHDSNMRNVTDVTPNTNSGMVLQFGPLAPLIGNWEGNDDIVWK